MSNFRVRFPNCARIFLKAIWMCEQGALLSHENPTELQASNWHPKLYRAVHLEFSCSYHCIEVYATFLGDLTKFSINMILLLCKYKVKPESHYCPCFNLIPLNICITHYSIRANAICMCMLNLCWQHHIVCINKFSLLSQNLFG